MGSDSPNESSRGDVARMLSGTNRPTAKGLARRSFLALIPLSYVAFRVAPAFASSPATLNFVAHQDDDLLFLSPDLMKAIQARRECPDGLSHRWGRWPVCVLLAGPREWRAGRIRGDGWGV